MKALINGVIVTKSQMVYGKALIYDENIIDITSDYEPSDGDEVIDVHGNMIIAGLIDLHIHGYAGCDVSDANAADIEKMSEKLTQNGVTAWCPTTMTVPLSEIEAAFDAVRHAKKAMESASYNGAQILGANCEGPFISAEKKGAQDARNIKKPDADFVIKNSDIIRLVTIAPEEDEKCEAIKKITQNTDVVVSMGHTCADLEQTRQAINAGARHVTHLYNAMPPLDHRSPGVLGAVLTDKSVGCELIADTFHINPALFTLTAQLKRNKLILITDCMRAGGMPDGNYTLGGQRVTVQGIECRLENGVIAGSVLKLNEAIRNMLANTELPLWKVVNMASLNAAEAVGEDKQRGSIEIGKRADFAIVDKNINVCITIVGGKVCFRKERAI